MTPVYRTSRPESAANVLLKHFRLVKIDCTYMNVVRGLDRRVRFRPDMIRKHRVYFAKVPSQVKRWQDNGGALICWRWRNDLECDAILFAECPKRMEAFPTATAHTRFLTVVNEPVTWRPFVEVLEARHHEHPAKLRRALRSLELVRHYIEQRPILTSVAVNRLLARQARPQQSSPQSFGSPADAARSPDTTG